MGETWGWRGWHTDMRCPLGRVQDGRHSNRRKLRRRFHGPRRPGDWPRTLGVPRLGRLTVCRGLPLLVNRTVGFFRRCCCRRRRRKVVRRGARNRTAVRHGHFGITVVRQTLHTGAWRRAPSLQESCGFGARERGGGSRVNVVMSDLIARKCMALRGGMHRVGVRCR